MSCSYQLKTDEDCLLAEIEGTASSVDEIFQFDQAIIKEAEKLGLRKMLRDVRRVRFENVFFHDVLAFMEKRLDMTDRTKRLKVAAVYSQEDWQLGTMFETAAATSSFHYKSFLDIDEALVWLKES